MRFRAVIPDGLTKFLTPPQSVDEGFSENKSEDKCSEERTPGTKSDVAKEIEEIPAVRQLRQPKQHYPCPPLLIALCSWSIGLAQFPQAVNRSGHATALGPFHQHDIAGHDQIL